MITLSWWEQIIFGSALSFLTILQTKIKNQTELAALQGAITFLQDLLGGNVGAPAA